MNPKTARIAMVGLLASGSLLWQCTDAQAQKRKKNEGQQAAAREVMWRHDLHAALAEAAAAGKPVFADFYAEWCGPCVKMLNETMKDPQVIQTLNNQFIPVKLNVDVEKEAKEHYGVGGIPHLFFLRPDGSVAHDFKGYVDGPTFLTYAKAGLEKIGPLTPTGVADRSKRAFDQAMRALARKNYRSAYKLFSDIVAEGKEGVPEVEKAKAEIAEIDKAAGAQLEEIKALVDKKQFAEVAGRLDDLLTVFDGIPIAVEAKAYRDQLTSDPEAKLAIRTAEAERVYAETLADLEQKRYGIALTRLEGLAGQYFDLPVGAKIKAELDKLHSNPAIVKAVRDEEARAQSNAWLSLARTWAKNSDNKKATERAKSYYQKVIETFPDTSFAQEAETEIAQLDDTQA